MAFYSSDFPASSPVLTLAAQAAALALLPVALNLGLVDALVNGGSILQTREEKKPQRLQPEAAGDELEGGRQDGGEAAAARPQAPALSGAAVADLLAYYLPMFIPGYMATLMCLYMGLGGQEVKHLFNVDHAERLAFLWTTTGLWAGALGTFAGTLRDRKLIGRPQEMAMVGLPFALYVVMSVVPCMVYQDGVDLLRSVTDPFFLAHLLQSVWQH